MGQIHQKKTLWENVGIFDQKWKPEQKHIEIHWKSCNRSGSSKSLRIKYRVVFVQYPFFTHKSRPAKNQGVFEEEG